MSRQTRRRLTRARGKRSARFAFALPALPPESKPVRGLKLKTVSALTLASSLLCLAAFAASRPPVPSGRSLVSVVSEHSAVAKHVKAPARHTPTAR